MSDQPTPDAQKKEIDKNQEPLEDITPEKDPTGGAHNPVLDAQKKEIGEV
ncbi:MAG: hypothetical protein ACR2NX_10535 [Chthoniobacterales bacterium]